MNFDLGWKGLKLFKFLLQYVRLFHLIDQSPVALLTHSFAIVWTVSVVTPCHFVTPSHTSLKTTSFTHLIQICLAYHMGTFVNDRLGFTFLSCAFLSSFLKLTLVTVFAKAFGMVLPVLMTTYELLVWDFHHILALLTRDSGLLR